MWQPLKVSGQHWKMQFLRIADKIVERLAQQQVADVLARSFKEIDAFVVDVEKRIEQHRILKHACNEHSRNSKCQCDYCKIACEINAFRAIRGAVNYSHSMETASPGYIFALDKRLNQLHCLKRRLLGFPERVLKPNSLFKSHRIYNNAPMQYYFAG
jgi:hypothetical protein